MRFLVLFGVIVFLSGCSILTPLQKSKFITVNHLITNHKYNEAKGIIDDLVIGKRSSKWPETWYYKGLLCQSAHQEGVKKSERALQELYPDQLFLAHQSYEMATKFGKGGGLIKKIRAQYTRLVNDLQRMGTTTFTQRNFQTSSRAFDLALNITESKLPAVPLDTNLLYNAAVAAFENRSFDMAIVHLRRLEGMRHSDNVSHLLFLGMLSKGDSLGAKQVLERSIEVFPKSERLVLVLADYHLGRNNPAQAIEAIEGAIARQDSVSFDLLNAKGLVFKNSSQYQKAIEIFTELTGKFPNNSNPLANIATCYYNIGVEFDERARVIANIAQFQSVRESAISNYKQALHWIEKALVKSPKDSEIQLFAERLKRLVGTTIGNPP